MPHIFQPTTTKPIPANAKRFTRDGCEWVKWRPYRKIHGVEWIEAEVTAPGKCRVTSPNWWVEWTDLAGERHKEPIGPDRRAAEAREAEIVLQLHRERLGQQCTPAAYESLSLIELAQQYKLHLQSLDRDPKHVRQTIRQITTVVTDSRWSSLKDVTLDGWTRWVNNVRGEDGYGADTINHYLRSLRALIRWLMKTRKLAADPLFGAQTLNTEVDRRHVRRVLSPEDFRKLIDTARDSAETHIHLDGPSRAALYLVAGRTGLRAAVLAGMRPSDLRLDDPIPHVPIEAKFQKGKKKIEIPLSTATVAELRPWLRSRPVHQLLWPGTWFTNNDGPEILRRDLRAAGIPEETPDGTFDFHALRSQCGTDLANAGVPLTVVQKILGHSKAELTAKYYSRHAMKDLADAVEKVDQKPEPKDKPNSKRDKKGK